MADPIFLALLFAHVFFAIAWLGAALYTNMLLLPIMSKLSMSTRQELASVVVPRGFRYVIMMGSAALIFGVLLYGYINFVTTANATSSSGIPFVQAGALIGLLTLIAFSLVTRNTLQKMQQVSAQTGAVQASSAEPNSATAMAGLQNRLKIAGIAGMVLLIVVVALMVIGANI